jgi:hypothetical protein
MTILNVHPSGEAVQIVVKGNGFKVGETFKGPVGLNVRRFNNKDGSLGNPYIEFEKIERVS